MFAALRMAAAAVLLGCVYSFLNASVWPPNPGGTTEYSGDTWSPYAFFAIAGRSISWATACRMAGLRASSDFIWKAKNRISAELVSTTCTWSDLRSLSSRLGPNPWNATSASPEVTAWYSAVESFSRLIVTPSFWAARGPLYPANLASVTSVPGLYDASWYGPLPTAFASSSLFVGYDCSSTIDAAVVV